MGGETTAHLISWEEQTGEGPHDDHAAMMWPYQLTQANTSVNEQKYNRAVTSGQGPTDRTTCMLHHGATERQQKGMLHPRAKGMWYLAPKRAGTGPENPMNKRVLARFKRLDKPGQVIR